MYSTGTTLLSNSMEGSLVGVLMVATATRCQNSFQGVVFPFCKLMLLYHRQHEKSLLGDKYRLSISFHLRNDAELPYSSQSRESHRKVKYFEKVTMLKASEV